MKAIDLKRYAKCSTTSKKSALEERFLIHLFAAEIQKPQREYRFHPTRKWRLDFAWPDRKLAVEIEGGVWTGGRHTRPQGFIEDCRKYNALSLAGWRLLRFSGEMVRSGEAIDLVEEVFNEDSDKREVPDCDR